jgi:hypothetical protein
VSNVDVINVYSGVAGRAVSWDASAIGPPESSLPELMKLCFLALFHDLFDGFERMQRKVCCVGVVGLDGWADGSRFSE